MGLRRWGVAISAIALAGTFAACSKETCPAGDLACLNAGVVWAAYATGTDQIFGTPEALGTVSVDTLLALTTTTSMRLAGSAAFSFTAPDDHGLASLSWADPLGCRPAFCMSHCPRGVRCSGQARCSPLRRDHTTSATTLHWVSYAKAPAADTSYDLQIVAVSAPGCPADVTALIAAGSTTLQVSPPLRLPVTWKGGDSGGGGSCAGGGLHCSVSLCIPDGRGACSPCSGSRDYCLSAAEFAGATGGMPLPSACAPEGATGCFSSNVGTTVKPCCPGLSCRVATVCGGGSVVGGTCLP